MINYDKQCEWFDGLSGRLCLTLTWHQVEMLAHQGDCQADAEQVSAFLKDQFSAIPDQLKIDVLKEYGAWNDQELIDGNRPLEVRPDTTQNNCRLIWIAANDIKEGELSCAKY